MGNKQPKWTSQQTLAIETIDRGVLVTASAGTGKTAVLAKRCVDRLTDPSDPADAMSIVVLTFTDAAAEEMRSRIAENLHTEYLSKPSDYLRDQLLKLDAAWISTIHSFCKKIITENFHAIGIDPSFQIIDEDQRRLIRSMVLEEIVEQAWAEQDLAGGLNELLGGRNIQSSGEGFLKNIIRISELLDSTASRQQWYERASALADIGSFAAADLEKRQWEIVERKLNQCKSQLNCALKLDSKLTKDTRWSAQINDLLAATKKCSEHLEGGRSDKCAEAIRDFVKPRLRPMPKGFPKPIAEIIKAPIKKMLDTFSKLSDLAVVNTDYDRLIAPAASLQTKMIIELAKRFDRAYSQVKDGINCLDYSDLQHLALEVLNKSESIAESYRQKFKYIFVDEYQDINAVQQSILDKLTSGDNLFVVGDIKQSIYAFRQAKPDIFLNHLNNASEDPGENDTALRVTLSDNYRSRKGVLDFVNKVFARIMTTAAASIDYDSRTFLSAGFDYEPSGDTAVEVCILDDEPAENGSEITYSNRHRRQAAFIANRIKEMIAAKNKIFDKQTDTYRLLDYHDIVILMRSPAKAANEYARILQLAAIPVSSQSASGYFAATEISDCLCLLKVLDNPQRDIELAAVLRSPFFAVTDNELAMIRLHSKNDGSGSGADFYQCLLNYRQNGPDKSLHAKLTNALAKIEEWRSLGRGKSIADLLWQIFRHSGYLSFVSGLAGGKQRRANLLKMHERAIQFEGFAGPAKTSLRRFVEFVEQLLEEGNDWAPAEPDSSAENAVRIMSVHKSKGLEFAVVFLAELNRKFNMQDTYGDCLIDEDMAIGLSIAEPGSNARLTTGARQVIAEKKTDITLAEEMRILYVAMTRAREKLILTACKKQSDCEKLIEPLVLSGGGAVPYWQLKSAKSHFDWILYALAETENICAGLDIESGAEAEDFFKAKVISRDTSDKILQSLMSTPTAPAGVPDEDKKFRKQTVTNIRENIGWEYPFAKSTTRRAKKSPSESEENFEPESQFAAADYSMALAQLPKASLSLDDKEREKIAPRLVGSATHLVIEELDLANISGDSIRATIENLSGEGAIVPSVAGKIDVAAIRKFFDSDLGRLAIKNRQQVLREWQFTFIPDSSDPAESSIITGLVDMIIPTDDGLVIIDFKTDGVSADFAEQRAKDYAGQIRYYTAAASAILGEKVAASYLYFLKPSLAIKMAY